MNKMAQNYNKTQTQTIVTEPLTLRTLRLSWAGAGAPDRPAGAAPRRRAPGTSSTG